MTQFTPGPWSVSEQMLTAEFGKPGRGYIAILAEGHVADIFPFGGRRGGSDRPIDTHRANARLIAAAPELYVSLQHAVEIIQKYVPRDALGMNAQGDPDVPGGYEQWPLLDEYLHYMNAALAKATGSAQSPAQTPEQAKKAKEGTAT